MGVYATTMTTAVKTSVMIIDLLTFFLFVTGVGEFQDTTFKITNLRKKFVVVRLRPP